MSCALPDNQGPGVICLSILGAAIGAEMSGDATEADELGKLVAGIKAEAEKYDMTLTMDVDMLTDLPAPDEQVVLRCSEDLAALCTAAFDD